MDRLNEIAKTAGTGFLKSSRAVRLLSATAAFLFPVAALAQDAPIATGWDWALTLYGLAGTALMALVTWGTSKLVKLIDAKVVNEYLAGVLGRLTSSVSDAVAMVDQTARKKLLEARAPKSPGGKKITEAEAKGLRDAVWEALKSEYGGWGGLFSALKRIGIGDEAAAASKINTMIEAAVSTHKMRKRASADPQ